MPSLHLSNRVLGNHSSNRLISAAATTTEVASSLLLDKQKERSFHKPEIGQARECTDQSSNNVMREYAVNNSHST